jgi:myo-inositol-1(or 4)-monophosphatase
MDLQHTTEIIIGIAQEAGALALAGFGGAESTLKYDGSLVTTFDRQCEELIRERLRVHFPGHSIFGEETGLEGPADNEWIWYLDPIDGTSNFVFGLPIWGVSIGVAYQGRPAAGAFCMPLTQQTWWAWRGGGAWCDGRRLQLYSPTAMNSADLVCISSTILDRYEITCPQKLRSYGSSAHALAAMAGGSYAGVVHDYWHLHDLAAGLLMCEEVGAVITRDDGSPFTSFDGVDPKDKAPTLVIAGANVHARILAAVQLKR